MPGRRSQTIDFVVIGAQKGGTTTLWQHLRHHPELALPPAKEAPFFTEPAYERGIDWFIEETFKDAPAGCLLGTVTPHYMLGTPQVPVPIAAERMRRDLPEVKLLALLRDPVRRAVSQWMMVRRWGIEERPLERALDEALAEVGLREAQNEPSSTNSYLAQGEYGRILGCYLEKFSDAQLHVEFTSDLERDPAGVMRRIFGFLGVDEGWQPPWLGDRWFSGSSRPLVAKDASDALYEQLLRDVFPLAGAARDDLAAAFWLSYQQWNVAPDRSPHMLDPRLEQELRSHFAPDAEALEALVRRPLPWQI